MTGIWITLQEGVALTFIVNQDLCPYYVISD